MSTDLRWCVGLETTAVAVRIGYTIPSVNQCIAESHHLGTLAFECPCQTCQCVVQRCVRQLFQQSTQHATDLQVRCKHILIVLNTAAYLHRGHCCRALLTLNAIRTHGLCSGAHTLSMLHGAVQFTVSTLTTSGCKKHLFVNWGLRLCC